MPETRVVNKRKEKFDVDISRNGKWGNPFTNRPSGTRAQYIVPTLQDALDSYEDWLEGQPDLIVRLHELKGKRLGCTCKPKPCHGDILVKMVRKYCGEDEL